MKTKRKTKQPAAAEELRVRSIVLVDAKGRECARLGTDSKGTTFTLRHPGSDFVTELRCEPESAGMTIDNNKRGDPLCAALTAWAEPQHGVHGYGVLTLRDAGADAKDGGCNQHSMEAEQVHTLRSFDEWLPTRNESADLRRAARILRSVHRTVDPKQFGTVIAMLAAEDRDERKVRE